MLEATKVKDQYADSITSRQGVVGVGTGLKWINGVPSDIPAILVFVEKKRTKKGIAQKFSVDDVIPPEIDGVPTDVIEVGTIIKQSLTQKVRPLKPGYSCGHRDITAGTIGGFFIDHDGDPVILTNNHVAANENKASIGDLLYQPGVYDVPSGTNLALRDWPDPMRDLPYVGTLKKFVALGAENNRHDSATVRLHPKIISAGLVDTLYPVVNKQCTGFGIPTPGMQVQKCGRTTGYTTGRVMAVDASFTIGYDFGPAHFTECVVLGPMSQGGDSGSIIMDMSMRAVALLFAGSPKVTIASLMSTVVDEYGLKLWNPGGTAAIDTFDLGNKTWQRISAGGTIGNDGRIVTITSEANRYAYLESPITDFTSVSVDANTGSDVGATWGPGLTVVWPTGSIKVNVRFNDRFGGYFNGTYNINIGSVKPNTTYSLRIRKSQTGTYIGEVQDNGKWFTVIELPDSIFPGHPTSVRIGKTDLSGNPTNNSAPGALGTCTFTNFQCN